MLQSNRYLHPMLLAGVQGPATLQRSAGGGQPGFEAGERPPCVDTEHGNTVCSAALSYMGAHQDLAKLMFAKQ